MSRRWRAWPRLAGAAPAAVSRHLAKLWLASLVKGRRVGTFVFYYSAADDHVKGLLDQALFHADHSTAGWPVRTGQRSEPVDRRARTFTGGRSGSWAFRG